MSDPAEEPTLGAIRQNSQNWVIKDYDFGFKQNKHWMHLLHLVPQCYGVVVGS